MYRSPWRLQLVGRTLDGQCFNPRATASRPQCQHQADGKRRPLYVAVCDQSQCLCRFRFTSRWVGMLPGLCCGEILATLSLIDTNYLTICSTSIRSAVCCGLLLHS